MTGETAPSESTEPTEADIVNKWTMELQDADRFVEKWHKQGDRTLKRYLDEGGSDDVGPKYTLNLFYSNIVTLRAMLYAKIPKVEADRRFLDPNDDVARVASEMITRILQNDLNDSDDDTSEVLKSALQDRLLPGYGGARVKYCLEEKPVQEGSDETYKHDEWCEVVYTHWKDVRWSPCRTRSEIRWKAFRSYLTKDEVKARFGAEKARDIPYSSKGPELDPEKRTDKVAETNQNDKQAEVWEIWDKTTKKVYWYVKGYRSLLDSKDDPLELKEFFPDALPMVANTTTTRYLPKPDYAMAQDLYEEIDALETRIALLTAAAKCVGVYDQSAKEVQRMFTDGVENQLIPVDNWAMFAEKGGLKGVLDWLPLEAVVNAIAVLQQQQQARIQQLYQVTGMSDILRGQATQAGVTATEQRIKAQFGSTRIQALQDEFAEFAQDLMSKKAQLIQRYYDPERIVQLSNIMATPDAELVPEAVKLLKNYEEFNCRVAVRAESMAQVDYDMLKMERTEYLAATSQFLGQSAGLIQEQPEAAPFLIQLLKFGLSAFKGANEIEGVIDQFGAAVEQKLQQNAANPKPDPEQQKMQMQMQMEQAKQQGEMQKSQAEMQMKQQQAQEELAIERERFALEREKMLAELAFQREKLELEKQKMQLDLQLKAQGAQTDMALQTQKAETELAVAEQKAATDISIQKQQATSAQEMEQQRHQQSLKQGEQQNAAKIQQMKQQKQVTKPSGEE